MTDQRAPMLLEEQPISVYPRLAKMLGINEAIILQQLHFLLWITEKAQRHYNFIDGKWWVYNTYKEWVAEHFIWLSEVTVKRLFTDLEEKKFVLSRQGVKNKSDRRKWYTIDYEAFRAYVEKYEDETIGSKRSIQPSDQNDLMEGSKRSDGYTETTTETKETTTSGASAPVAHEGQSDGVRQDDGHLSDERVPTKPLQSFKVKAHINEVRYVTASKPLDDDTTPDAGKATPANGARAEPVTDGKRLEEKKPRARSAAQMDTDAKVLALAVAFYGSENYAKKDYGVIAMTANNLEESGILRDDFAGYVRWVRGYAKSSGDWTVTLTSLTTGGRMTDYLTRKKAFGPVDVEDSDDPRNRAPQQKTILSPEEQKRYFERIAEREKGMKK